jgi:uncharacterized protein involved in exopolysaccharide biosynthesis
MNERPVMNPIRDADAASAPAANPTASESMGLGLLDLAEMFAPRLGLLILLPLLVAALTYTYTRTQADLYTGTTRFLPPQQQQGSAAALLQGLGGALGGLASASGAIKNPADQYVAMLRSRSIQDALIARFKLQQEGPGTPSREALRARLAAATQVVVSKEGLIEVSYTAASATMAADGANAYIDELRKLLAQMSLTEAQQRRVFFEKHLREAKDNLIRAELDLQQVGVNPAMLRAASPQVALEGVARLTAQVSALEVRISAMRGYMTDSSPELQQAMHELAALKGQLAVANRDSPRQGSERGQYVARYREFKYQETLYELFARQYELARVDESREGPAVQVLDAAVPPETRSGPKRARTAMLAGAASLLLLLVYVFVSHRLSVGDGDAGRADQMRRIQAAIRRGFWR